MQKMIEQLMGSITKEFTPVLDSAYTKDEYCEVDMSSSNLDLNVFLLTDPAKHHRYLQQHIKQHNAKVAYGGYLEHRSLYDRSDHFQGVAELEKRNIHLGIDLWCDAGTPVLSPLDGVIHSFQYNNNFGDYGPTIILQHTFEEHSFHTLFGHLSLESLEGKTVGQSIKAGESIAELGASELNGDYAPHLHFQIVLNIEDMIGDYPGVCSKSKLGFYQKNCPDPNLILKIY